MEDKKTVSEKIFKVSAISGGILLLVSIYLITGGTATPALVAGTKIGLISVLLADCTAFTFQHFEEKQNEIYNRIAIVSQTLNELEESKLTRDLFWYLLTLLVMHYIFKGGSKIIREYKLRKFFKKKLPEFQKTLDSFDPKHVSHAKEAIGEELKDIDDIFKTLRSKGAAIPEHYGSGQGVFSRLRESIAKKTAQIMKGQTEETAQRLIKEIEQLHKKFDQDLVNMAKKLDINLEQTLALAKRYGFKDPNMALLLQLDFETTQLKRFLSVKQQLVGIDEEIGQMNTEITALRKSRKGLKRKSVQYKKIGEEIDTKLAERLVLSRNRSKILTVLNFLKGTRTPQSTGDWAERLASTEGNYITPLRRNVAAFDAFTQENIPVSIKGISLDELSTYLLSKDPSFAIMRGIERISEADSKFVNKWPTAVRDAPVAFDPPRSLPAEPEQIDKIIHLVYIVDPPSPAIQSAISESLNAVLREEGYQAMRYTLRISYKSKFDLFNAFKTEQVNYLKPLRFPKAVNLPAVGSKRSKEPDKKE